MATRNRDHSPHAELDEYGYAAFCVSGSPGPFIHVGVVRRYQRDVREEVGKVWAREGETSHRGWVRARKAGWRVIAVRVTPAFGDAQREFEAAGRAALSAQEDGRAVQGGPDV